MAPAEEARPDGRVDEALGALEPVGVGANVLEEAELSTVTENAVHLLQCGALVGTEQSTSDATAASKVSSPAGSSSAMPSTTSIGTAADSALRRAVSRKYGSGSTASTPVTSGG